MARFDERSASCTRPRATTHRVPFLHQGEEHGDVRRAPAANMQMPDILHMVAHAELTISPREDEMPELETLRNDRKRACPIEITKATMADRVGKVNLLFQYISRVRCEAFSLVADGSYISQNASRISRALYELCLRRGGRAWRRRCSRRQSRSTWACGRTSTAAAVSGSGRWSGRSVCWRTNEPPWTGCGDMSASEIGAMLRLNADPARTAVSRRCRTRAGRPRAADHALGAPGLRASPRVHLGRPATAARSGGSCGSRTRSTSTSTTRRRSR